MSSSRLAGAVLVFMALTPLVKADIIASLGDTASALVSGTVYSSSTLLGALTGAAPFNATCGNLTTKDCATSWTFSYLFPAGQTVTGATLTLGIGNLESSVTGSRVASYLDGATDLTAALNSASKALDGGAGSIKNEYDILTVTIPSTAFAALQSGSTAVSLALQGQGIGLPTVGPTKFYSVDLVYSTLDLKTAAPVPEPAALPLLLTAVGAFGLLWARRKQNRERVGQTLSSVEIGRRKRLPYLT